MTIFFDDTLVDEFGVSITDEALSPIYINKSLDTTWRNYSLVRNSATSFSLYIDGVLFQTKTISGISSTATVEDILNLFTSVMGGAYDLDEISVFSRALTTTERADVIANGYNLLLPESYRSGDGDFAIDTGATQIDLDTPQRKYNVRKIIGNGSSVSGGDYYSDRKISFSRIFKKDGVSTSGALTTARNDFINKFITSSDDIYFIRNYNGVLQYLKVYPLMGAEKYKSLMVSEDFAVSLLCDLPFFTDALSTLTPTFTKNTRYYDYSITIVGLPVPFIFEGTFSSNDTGITIGVFENYGVTIIYPFLAGDVVRIDSGSLRLWVNDVERFNATIVGTPFTLLSGASTLRIEAVSNMTLCSVSYTGRYL